MTPEQVAEMIAPVLKELQDKINDLINGGEPQKEKLPEKQPPTVSDAVAAWIAQKEHFKGKSLDDFQKPHQPQNPTTKLGGKAI